MATVESGRPTTVTGCLAKQWPTLLSTPQFIKSHLARKPHQENLILITPPPSRSIHSIATIEDDTSSRKLDLPGKWTEVVGSCDGLVLLVDEEEKKFLVNPITLEQVKLPNSPLALKRGESFSMHGFGYDSLRDDYKVVTLSYCDTDNEYEPDCADTFVDVYSVKMGVWKRVESSPYDHAVPHIFCGAFVNGAIHWLASNEGIGLWIPPPSGVDVEKFVFNKLVVLGESLCMLDVRQNDRTDVWIMKEYGLAESWTKFSICADYEYDMLKPLCFIGDEEVVLVTEGETLVVYNQKEGNLKDLVVDGVPAMFVDGGIFVESLVSPSSNVN
ncbi:hypothetical protein DH2020_004562 [Rehmannia glutinosa]|uniref:F-box associated beta-propeller type 1 domain-containing protein n=1 Tax=Rehmannia glutinosa TaxID=99300 RepID=A0ABR0XPQ4_REHGL